MGISLVEIGSNEFLTPRQIVRLPEVGW